jgi:hypothetical protein
MLKLVNKVTNEIDYDASNGDLTARPSSTRERVFLIVDRLMKIAFWRFEYLDQGIAMPNLDQQMNAMRTIIDMDLALLRAELVDGIYKAQARRGGRLQEAPRRPDYKRSDSRRSPKV